MQLGRANAFIVAGLLVQHADWDSAACKGHSCLPHALHDLVCTERVVNHTSRDAMMISLCKRNAYTPEVPLLFLPTHSASLVLFWSSSVFRAYSVQPHPTGQRLNGYANKPVPWTTTPFCQPRQSQNGAGRPLFLIPSGWGTLLPWSCHNHLSCCCCCCGVGGHCDLRAVSRLRWPALRQRRERLVLRGSTHASACTAGRISDWGLLPHAVVTSCKEELE